MNPHAYPHLVEVERPEKSAIEVLEKKHQLQAEEELLLNLYFKLSEQARNAAIEESVLCKRIEELEASLFSSLETEKEKIGVIKYVKDEGDRFLLIQSSRKRDDDNLSSFELPMRNDLGNANDLSIVDTESQIDNSTMHMAAPSISAPSRANSRAATTVLNAATSFTLESPRDAEAIQSHHFGEYDFSNIQSEITEAHDDISFLTQGLGHGFACEDLAYDEEVNFSDEGDEPQQMISEHF